MVAFCIREDWTCWICGGNVPVDFIEGSPSAPSKDHVVPRSVFSRKRSRYDKEFYQNNIRLAHRHCNSERQSKQVTEEDAETYARRLAKAQDKWNEENDGALV